MKNFQRCLLQSMDSCRRTWLACNQEAIAALHAMDFRILSRAIRRAQRTYRIARGKAPSCMNVNDERFVRKIKMIIERWNALGQRISA